MQGERLRRFNSYTRIRIAGTFKNVKLTRCDYDDPGFRRARRGRGRGPSSKVSAGERRDVDHDTMFQEGDPVLRRAPVWGGAEYWRSLISPEASVQEYICTPFPSFSPGMRILFPKQLCAHERAPSLVPPG